MLELRRARGGVGVPFLCRKYLYVPIPSNYIQINKIFTIFRYAHIFTLLHPRPNFFPIPALDWINGKSIYYYTNDFSNTLLNFKTEPL